MVDKAMVADTAELGDLPFRPQAVVEVGDGLASALARGGGC